MDLKVKSAKDFVDALSKGKTPEEAALSVGESLGRLMRSTEVVGRLEQLRDYNFKKAEDRKALVLARMVEVLLNGEDRDSTAAARVLASDPELGMTGNQGPSITINISDDVAKLDAGDPWEEEK